MKRLLFDLVVVVLAFEGARRIVGDGSIWKAALCGGIAGGVGDVVSACWAKKKESA